jgi:hypothetical protein
MFRYEGLEAVDDFKTTSCHSGYYHFLVKKSDTDETVLDFYTNGYLDGMFHYDKYQCSYRQCRGTMQFSLPVKSKRALRDALRKMALKQLGEEY